MATARGAVFRQTSIGWMCREDIPSMHRICDKRGCICWCHSMCAAYRWERRKYVWMQEVRWDEWP